MGILVAGPSAWAELEAGLLAEIAKRIARLSDYASFATVCSSWRNAALPEERRRRPWAQFPGLLIAGRRRERKPGDRFLPVAQIRNYLGNQKSHYRLRRAFLQPPAAAAAAEEWDCRGTQEGWVVMVKPYEDGNRAVNVTLRNPLTHVDIALPPLHAGVSTAPFSWRVEKAVLSSSPGADSSGRCYVLMFHDLRVTELITVRLVSLCEVGAGEGRWRDVEFTEMPIDHQDYSIEPPPTTAGGSPPPALDDRDAIYINGNNNSSYFYILNRGILHLLDPSAAEARTTAVCRIEGKLPFRQTKWRESFHLNHYFYSAEAGCHVVPHFHLAKLGAGGDDELAVAVRLVGYSPGQGETGVRKFVVYTWRRSEDRQGYYWEEAGDLGRGGAALFVGTCQASVTLRLPAGVNVAAKRDHIYFALFSPANVSGVEIGEYNYLRRGGGGSGGDVHLFKFGPSTIEPQDLASSSSSIDGKCTRKRCEEMDCTCAAATIQADGEENDEQYAFDTATNRFEALLTL
ncbi:unnamed protein product [Linum tenue]|uniref:KIB1-4 beta-propeller domain-containing protein n=1 Tax=Linum tenue TaxID=586396 RepID=A0AAV0PJG6_9ROSI|nr:unnamed protein product [Linum tenue]